MAAKKDSANAALLKGGEEARAYVVERVRERLKERGLPPPPPSMVVAIRAQAESMGQCLKDCGLPPNFFSQRYSNQRVVEALEEKSRSGVSLAKASENVGVSYDIFYPRGSVPPKTHASPDSVKLALKEAGIVMAWAHQPRSDPAAIMFAPSNPWSVCREFWRKGKRHDLPSDEGKFPSVALVSLNALQQGMTARKLDMRHKFHTRTLSRLNKIYESMPPVKKRRVVEIVERGRFGEMVKAHRSYKCQICEALEQNPLVFDKNRGGFYAEAHHVDPVAVGGSLGPENIIAVCAHHHRQIHHGKTEFAGKTQKKFVYRIDGKEIGVERYSPK